MPVSRTAWLLALALWPGFETAASAQAAPPTLPPAGEGRRVFLKFNCYGCHGLAAGGGMGPNIVGAEAGDISEVVMGGGENGMPSFSRWLKTTDVNNLAAYLNSIGTPSEPKWTHWWEPNPKQ